MPSKTYKLFIMYAREDKPIHDRLISHLSPLINRDSVKVWSDHMIKPGELWDDEIVKKLKESDIILMLISADFFRSEYIRTVELKLAKARHDKQLVRLIPIIARDVYWKEDPIVSKLQVLPDGEKAIDTKGNWQSDDQPYELVVRGIVSIFNEIKPKKEQISIPQTLSNKNGTKRKAVNTPKPKPEQTEELQPSNNSPTTKALPPNDTKKVLPEVYFYFVGLPLVTLLVFLLLRLCATPYEPKVAVDNPPRIDNVVNESPPKHIDFNPNAPVKKNDLKPIQNEDNYVYPVDNNPFHEPTRRPIKIEINIIHPPKTSVKSIFFEPRVEGYIIGKTSTDVTVIKGTQYKADLLFSDGTKKTIHFGTENLQIVLQE